MNCRVASVASADGLLLRYEVRGNREPTLVLVHGWSHNRNCWEQHWTALARSNRVAALDLGGFGESGTKRSSWTMHGCGEDVAAVVQDLHTSEAVLVGHSMGAAAALEAALLVPQHVTGVVIVDALHDPDMKFSDSTIDGMVAWMRSLEGDAEKIRAALFSSDTPKSLIDRCIVARPQTLPAFWWDVLRNFYRWYDSRLTAVLEHLEVPVQAINTERVETKTDAFRRYAPSFTVATVPGVGHMGIIWEEVARFDGLLLDAVRRFLEQSNSAG